MIAFETITVVGLSAAVNIKVIGGYEILRGGTWEIYTLHIDVQISNLF
jgi:hypothetical protein